MKDDRCIDSNSIAGGSPALPVKTWPFFSHKLFNPALPEAALTSDF
jgi:hypothetical protein